MLGTRWLVDSAVYEDALRDRGLGMERPDADERDAIDRIIMGELVKGLFKPGSVDDCRRVIAGLKDRGCDAVILGCTELPLIIDDGNSSLPTIDTTRLLARAALRRAVAAEG